MQKKLILLFILFGITSFNCYSEEIKFQDFENSFGLKASNMSGYGFFYNRVINNNVQMQMMGLIYYYKTEKELNSHTIFNYDIGAELQYNFYKTQKSRLYMLAGGYYYFDDDVKLIENFENYKIENNSYNVGVGVAMEFFYKRFVFGCDLGYKFFHDSKEITDRRNGGYKHYPASETVTKIGAGISVGITF